MTSIDERESAPTAPAILQARLKRAFLTATLPGTCQVVTEDPEAAADVAMRVSGPALEAARLDERKRCAEHLRSHGALLRSAALTLLTDGDTLDMQRQLDTAEAFMRAADLLDPPGPIQGAHAKGD